MLLGGGGVAPPVVQHRPRQQCADIHTKAAWGTRHWYWEEKPSSWGLGGSSWQKAVLGFGFGSICPEVKAERVWEKGGVHIGPNIALIRYADSMAVYEANLFNWTSLLCAYEAEYQAAGQFTAGRPRTARRNQRPSLCFFTSLQTVGKCLVQILQLHQTDCDDKYNQLDKI